MRSQPLRSSPLGKAGSLPTRLATLLVAACALFTVTAPSLKAQTAAEITDAQNDIKAELSSGTIVTSSSTVLATAVAKAIKADSSSTLTPAIFAEAALLPYPYPGGTVRQEPGRDSAAVLVTGSAIAQLVATGTSTKVTEIDFTTDVAAITDAVIDVSSTNASNKLTTAGREMVGKEALGVISDAYTANTGKVPRATLLAADEGVGKELATDSYLEGLSSDGLTVILESVMGGVNGVKGTSVAVAAFAAEYFTAGLVSTGSVPNQSQGMTFPAFAVDILRPVSINQSVDELVLYELGLHDDGANQTALVNIAESVFKAYPAGDTKFVQGLAGAIPKGNKSETARINFADALTTGTVAAAPKILEGMTFVDPFYASEFTTGVFNSIYAKNPSTLLTDGTLIASGVGNVLGQDANELTQIANVYGTFISSGKLPTASAGGYATALIGAAESSDINSDRFTGAAAGGGGGLLKLGAAITNATVTDLASITDVLADGIVSFYKTAGTLNTSETSTAASDIGNLAEAVAKFVGTETFSDSSNSKESGPVAEFIAGTLADYIEAVISTTNTATAILNAIKTDVEKISTNSTFDSDISSAITAAED